MYSPLTQTRIIGDVNIARYLSRFLVPDIYDDTDATSIARIDNLLDLARQVRIFVGVTTTCRYVFKIKGAVDKNAEWED